MKTALMIVLFVVSSGTAVAQDSTHVTEDSATQAPLYRDPQKARFLGAIIPGAGYVYVGKYLNGYLTWFSAFTGLTIGSMYFKMGCGFNDCVSDSDHATGKVLGVGYMVLGIAVWAQGAYKAGREAERLNRRHQQKLTARPIVETGPTGRVTAGVNVEF